MLKSVKEPTLPALPDKEEIKDPERLLRWWRGLLTVIKESIAFSYEDHKRLEELPVYANNAAAITGGLVAGQFYRTNGDPDTVCVVH